MGLLKPSLSIEHLSDIDLDRWHNDGIRCILIDLDNTVTPWGKMEITDETLDLISRSRDMGITVMLFSNAREHRAREAARLMGVGYFSLTMKPLPFRYLKAIAALGFKNPQIMTIGDQVFTDVLGGNLVGCTTVLITPLSEAEYTGTKVLRYFERLIVGRKIVYKYKDISYDTFIR